MTFETISIDKRDKGVAWIIVDHPPANTINEALMLDLEKAVDILTDDDSVRVVVLASNHPKIFLAGADLKGMVMNAGDTEEDDDDDVIVKQSARMQACFSKFATMPKPVIAAINGHALGGGCELALACDFRIMGNGRIGLTEVSLGLIPGAGGTQRLTHILGRAKAIELIFFAKQLEAQDAEAIGLVNRALDPENFEEEVQEFAEKLAHGAIHAMGLAKNSINEAMPHLEKGLEVESKSFSNTFITEEPSIGLAAFFQKQKADFLNS